MAWIFTCDCGIDIAGASQEEPAAVRRHVEADHPMSRLRRVATSPRSPRLPRARAGRVEEVSMSDE